MTLCSVIIPLYKGKKYIAECIESVLAQTYPEWELILIDDGSPDDTYDFVSKLLDTYKCDKIHLHHQENQGVANTRNKGVLLAKGEYVAFVDQDDKLKSDYIERLIAATEEQPYDIVLCGFEHRADDGKLKKRTVLHEGSWNKYRIVTPWARIYRKSFLIEKNIKFFTTPCCEDFYLTMHAYAATTAIKIVDGYAGYIWRYNKASVSNTKQKSVMIVDAVCNTYEKLMETLPADRVNDPSEEEYCFLRSCIYFLFYANRSESKEQTLYAYDKYFAFLQKYYPNYAKNPNIRLWKPKGEELIVKIMVCGFILLKKLHLSKLAVRFWHRLFR